MELLGVELTLELIKQRGGTRIHVPTPERVKRSYLCAVLGEEPLMRLARVHGANALEVPLCRNWRALSYLHAGGRSQAEIARLVGVTERTVRKLAREKQTPDHDRSGAAAVLAHVE